MTHPRISPHGFDTTRAHAGGVAVLEPKTRSASPHVVNLNGKIAAHQMPTVRKEKLTMPPRTFWARWAHLLDERIHLHDLRMRTLSIRARGWKDFPPADATTMRQAVSITSSRFFNEHPLAELTVLSWLHMTVIAISHIAQLPGHLIHHGIAGTMTNADEPIVVAATPALKPIAAIVRPLPLRARIAVLLSRKSRAMRHKAPQQIVLKEVAVKAQAITATAAIPVVRQLPVLKTKPNFFKRPAMGFAAVAFAIVLPITAYGSIDNVNGIKDRVVSTGKGALASMLAGGDAAKNRDFIGATRDFAKADAAFTEAKEELGLLASVLNAAPTLLPGTRVGAAAPLLNAAHEMAQGGERLAAGMSAADASTDPSGKINALRSYLSDALPHLERASQQLELVNAEAVPSEYRSVVAEAQRSVPQLTNAVRKATAVANVMGDILGQTQQKRYLVIFQNNAEIRPTGGFMGSFALLDVNKGKVVKMEIPGGGTYDLKGSLTQKVASPQPLHLINALWQFQDANWYPDFTSSAKQITWFYDKSGGPTTDGVISINASLMEDLLKVTGPIEMPEYGKTITYQNFYVETQRAVEVEYDKSENRPKQFIADLAPKVLEKLMAVKDNEQLLALAGLMDDALSRREVQMWMRNDDVQAKVSSLGWGGEMKSTSGDYLYVVHTNIAGQKSDLMMNDAIEHSVKVLPDGTGIVTLTLTRTHKGVKGAEFNGVRNVDYVRFYVPQGSMLVEAHGFDQPDPKLFKLGDGSELEDPAVSASEKGAKIDRDSGTRISGEGDKTVFGNWMQTDPGESSVVTLVYQLPAGTIPVARAPEGKLASFYGKIVGNRRDRIDYSLLVQKQSGLAPMTVTSTVTLPTGFSPSWQSPQRTQDVRGRWTVSADVDRDAFLATVAEGN